ncbi:hypothetical protein CLIB1444_05S04984 [[Candida] jaroonii]|uniref:Uncharacterized protein n=1 Tax=[Candida] jaroonii TaxID=467808 RepID=A0ACA9Y8G8_9ASCO|nr:hypothetical protein CLIB1444_05S04984 [[Candida] jaroonii]
MDRSRTEPSTPTRSTNSDLGGRYSLPRTNEIHLPVTDLLDIQKQWNIEGPRSIKRRKSSMAGDISTPGSARRSGPSTPRRSGDFNLTLTPRSRRSSIVVENTTKLNPEYEGPINLEFLKGFWNALDKDEQRKEEFRRRKGYESPAKNSPAKDSPAKNSPQLDHLQKESQNIAFMGDESLLLPSNTDELLRSPEVLTGLGNVLEDSDPKPEDVEPQEEDNPFIAPRTFSYLERILANQASRKRRASNDGSSLKQSRIVEEPVRQESQEAEEEPEVQDLQFPQEEEFQPMDQPLDFQPDNQPESLEEQPQVQENLPAIPEEFPQFFEPGPDVGYVTPTSPNPDLIEEEFLVEDAPNFQPIDEISSNFRAPKRMPPRIQSSKKRASSASTMSIKMVKDLIQVLKPVDKRIKIDPDAYQYIQQQSDIFLSTLMGDLEAYALHRNRKGNQINIKDVLLYMTRLQNDKSSSEFSQLARNHLPLELLMALDNNLKEAVPSAELQAQKTKRDDDDDLDYVTSSKDTRHIEIFSDSE